MADLRCDNGIKFGDLEDNFLEVKCRSDRCGAKAGVVVLHRFDVETGKLVSTRKFRDPGPVRKGMRVAEHGS